MVIKWDKILSVNNAVLDEQHKLLIDKINSLFGEEDSIRDSDNVTELINFMEEYAKIHFSYEESYFMSKNYPESSKHCNMHSEFIRTVDKLKNELNTKGASEKLAKELSKFAGNWLIAHIKNDDHKYCEFFDKGVCTKK